MDVDRASLIKIKSRTSVLVQRRCARIIYAKHIYIYTYTRKYKYTSYWSANPRHISREIHIELGWPFYHIVGANSKINDATELAGAQKFMFFRRLTRRRDTQLFYMVYSVHICIGGFWLNFEKPMRTQYTFWVVRTRTQIPLMLNRSQKKTLVYIIIAFMSRRKCHHSLNVCLKQF